MSKFTHEELLMMKQAARGSGALFQGMKNLWGQRGKLSLKSHGNNLGAKIRPHVPQINQNIRNSAIGQTALKAFNKAPQFIQDAGRNAYQAGRRFYRDTRLYGGRGALGFGNFQPAHAPLRGTTRKALAGAGLAGGLGTVGYGMMGGGNDLPENQNFNNAVQQAGQQGYQPYPQQNQQQSGQPYQKSMADWSPLGMGLLGLGAMAMGKPGMGIGLMGLGAGAGYLNNRLATSQGGGLSNIGQILFNSGGMEQFNNARRNWGLMQQRPAAMELLQSMGVVPAGGGGGLSGLQSYFQLNQGQKAGLASPDFPGIVDMVDQLATRFQQMGIPLEQAGQVIQSLGGIEGLKNPAVMEHIYKLIG